MANTLAFSRSPALNESNEATRTASASAILANVVDAWRKSPGYIIDIEEETILLREYQLGHLY